MTNNHNNSKDKGFVLIAVLILIAILVVIIFEFSFKARLKLHLAQNQNNAAKALTNAESGLAIARSILTQPQTKNQTGSAGMESLQNKTTPLSTPRTITLPTGTCTIKITEETGKLNINKLKSTNGKIDKNKVSHLKRIIEQIYTQLSDAPKPAPSLIANIIDFTDPDDKITKLTSADKQTEGVESDYYQSLETPYPCKNAPFDIIEELLLVKKMPPEFLNGIPSESIHGLKQYLTVYGSGEININTAPAAIIQSLSDYITPTMTASIIQMRTKEPLTSINRLQAIPGMTPAVLDSIQKLLTVNPTEHYYNIEATGKTGQFTRKINVIIKKEKSGKLKTILRKE